MKQISAVGQISDSVIGRMLNSFLRLRCANRSYAGLEREGYAARPLIIQACAVDSPHRRDRVWILAYAEGERCNNGDDRTNKRTTDRKKYAPSDACGAFSWLETGQWACEPAVPRVVNGLPDRLDRNKALGNAIVPQVAYEILRTIRAV